MPIAPFPGGMAGVKRLVEALVEQRRKGSIQVLSGQYVFKSATKAEPDVGTHFLSPVLDLSHFELVGPF